MKNIDPAIITLLVPLIAIDLGLITWALWELATGVSVPRALRAPGSVARAPQLSMPASWPRPRSAAS